MKIKETLLKNWIQLKVKCGSAIHINLCVSLQIQSAKVVTGRTNKITKCLTCMVESCNNNNLPMGVVVNRTMVTPNKSKHVLVLLMNTNSYNV